jgi:hypothetical protein
MMYRACPLHRIFIFLLVLSLTCVSRMPGQVLAQAPTIPTADQVVAAVNAYRASIGLFALQPNSALMKISQGQADYQAVSGQCTHTGPDGSRPIDRAYAAGYGSGQIIFISENIMCMPVGVTADAVVKSWATMDELHLGTLTKSQYKNIGAGVSELDGTVYFTIDVGVVAGGKRPTFTPAPTGSGTLNPNQSLTPAAISEWIIPVRTVIPMQDGSQVHLVQSGQSLWAIAIAYGVKIAQIITLNNLLQDNPTIYIGQKLKVRGPALTPTFHPTMVVAVSNPTPSASPTRKVTIQTSVTATQQPTPIPTSAPFFTPDRRGVSVALVILCAFGLLMLVVFIKQ